MFDLGNRSVLPHVRSGMDQHQNENRVSDCNLHFKKIYKTMTRGFNCRLQVIPRQIWEKIKRIFNWPQGSFRSFRLICASGSGEQGAL